MANTKIELENIENSLIIESMIRASQAILKYDTFKDSAQSIFDEACDLIGASSGYVALLTPDGLNNEVLFLESGGNECTVDPSLPMPIRGLREEAYQKKKAVYNNDFMNTEFVKLMPKGHMVLNNILFAPLIIENKAVGIIGIANKATPFTDLDANIAEIFGHYASISLVNHHNVEKLNTTIQSLESSLKEVKTLKSFLPICAHCKQIRDDEGYWHRVEEYISENTDTVFSHSICPSCLSKYYPEPSRT